MANPTLTSLVEAEAQLQAQITSIEQALSEIQEKRKGVQTVIAMFDPSQSDSAPADVPPEAAADPEEAPPAVAPQAEAKPKATSRKAKSGRVKKTAAKTVKQASRSGKAAAWQRYIKDEYQEAPLPETVGAILKSKPKAVYKIAGMMSELFKDTLPEKHFLSARNRVSNILSGGARKGDWHRGRAGTYSMTKKALPS